MAYRVEHKHAGFALAGYEEAKQSFMTLTVMVQVDVPYAACNTNNMFFITVTPVTHQWICERFGNLAQGS